MCVWACSSRWCAVSEGRNGGVWTEFREIAHLPFQEVEYLALANVYPAFSNKTQDRSMFHPRLYSFTSLTQPLSNIKYKGNGRSSRLALSQISSSEFPAAKWEMSNCWNVLDDRNEWWNLPKIRWFSFASHWFTFLWVWLGWYKHWFSHHYHHHHPHQ